MEDRVFSYWLGWMYSDGCIYSKISNYKYRYDIITGPASLLEDMKSYYSDFKIGLVYSKNSTRFEVLGGLKERIRFLDILYNTNCHTMIRKYESYSQSRAKLEEKSKK